MRLRYWLALFVVVLLAVWSLQLEEPLVALHPPRDASPSAAEVRELTSAPEQVTLTRARAAAPPSDATDTAREARPALEEVPVQDAVLDITFRREGAPLPGVDAWLADERAFGGEPHGIHDERVPFPSVAQFRESRVDGVAAFRELRPGRYVLGFDPLSEARRPRRFVAELLHTGQSYRVNLGSARVIGSVFGAEGRALPDVVVGVLSRDSDPDSRLLLSAFAVTDRYGEFEVVDLASGRYEVVFEPDARFDGLGDVERHAIVLARGGTAVVRFGPSGRAVRWRGRVTNAAGDPFEGRGSLVLTAADARSERSTTIDASGRFEIAFSSGAWHARAFLCGAPEAGFDLGVFELADHDLERDLVVPGAQLRGRVLGLTGAELADTAAAHLVSAHREGHEYPAAIRTVSLRADGTFVLDAVEEGTWVISTWPRALVGTGSLLVHVPAAGVVNLDLHLAQD